MEKESLDQNRSVHLVLYSTQRQNSTVRKLSRLPGGRRRVGTTSTLRSCTNV